MHCAVLVWVFNQIHFYLIVKKSIRINTNKPHINETIQQRQRQQALRYKHWILSSASRKYLWLCLYFWHNRSSSYNNNNNIVFSHIQTNRMLVLWATAQQIRVIKCLRQQRHSRPRYTNFQLEQNEIIIIQLNTAMYEGKKIEIKTPKRSYFILGYDLIDRFAVLLLHIR